MSKGLHKYKILFLWAKCQEYNSRAQDKHIFYFQINSNKFLSGHTPSSTFNDNGTLSSSSSLPPSLALFLILPIYEAYGRASLWSLCAHPWLMSSFPCMPYFLVPSSLWWNVPSWFLPTFSLDCFFILVQLHYIFLTHSLSFTCI